MSSEAYIFFDQFRIIVAQMTSSIGLCLGAVVVISALVLAHPLSVLVVLIALALVFLDLPLGKQRRSIRKATDLIDIMHLCMTYLYLGASKDVLLHAFEAGEHRALGSRPQLHLPDQSGDGRGSRGRL